MELLRRLALLAALAGLAAGLGAEQPAASNATKQAAVEKVINLLEDLQSTVMEEGEKEAATYNKFACFCKDTSADKAAAIAKGEDSKTTLTADIGSLAARREELDGMIETAMGEIETAEGEMKVAETERQGQLKLYQTEESDLAGALSALEGAIKALKSSKPSLVQLQGVAETVKMAASMADALGLSPEKAQRALAFFQEQPEVPTENYKFHSTDIISTLEGLLVDFKDTKRGVDEAEVAAVQAHNTFMQEKENFIKGKEKEVADHKKEKAEKQAAIATASQDLSVVAAQLLDDQQYLTGLSDMCSNKAKTWDVRSQVRQDELSALTQAIAIVKGAVKEKTTAATIRFAQRGMSVRLAEAIVRDPASMEAVEAEAEAADAPSFVQKQALRGGAFRSAVRLRRASPSPADDGSQTVMNMLLDKGKQLHSAMLSSLATQIGQQGGADKFAKVKELIQELIERLLKEAANEANQKGWCDKALSDASQKRDYAAEEVMSLNANLAQLEATRDTLVMQLATLATEIEDLKTSRSDAETMRADEKAENEATIAEANEGRTAVQEAIQVLQRFYGTAANSEVDLTLAQQPAIDAPDAGFDAGEAYKGLGGKAGGVIGMLEVIEGDFTRTVTETEAAEKQAEQDHLEFMTETGKSLAAKEKEEEEKTRQKDDTEGELTTDGESFRSQNDLLKGAVQELIQLKAACIDTGMSYQDRVGRRQDEIEALHKALCIFENFAQYGPDAATSASC
mmetsp:Transcript_12838/g.33020  ORF Transcript_12838/g.33020 Transcript_12838/m.33020 type:complete len:741 (-) Transcript_12838:2-2224(-)